MRILTKNNQILVQSSRLLTLNNIPTIPSLPTLFTPTAIYWYNGGDTLAIDDENNGAFAEGYQIFDGDKIYWHTTAQPLKIQDFGEGQHSLYAIAVGKGFNDSLASEVLEYAY